MSLSMSWSQRPAQGVIEIKAQFDTTTTKNPKKHKEIWLSPGILTIDRDVSVSKLKDLDDTLTVYHSVSAVPVSIVNRTEVQTYWKCG